MAGAAPPRLALVLVLALALARLAPAGAFHVALDAEGIQALKHRFTVLDLPKVQCTGRAAASGAWHPHCAHGLTKHVECEYNGFQYSMEWYFMEMLRENPLYLAGRPEDADFVYFPQCVSQVYFALRGSYNISHWAAIAAAEAEYLVPLLRWAHGTDLHGRHGGRNFWTVFSMDLGRQDFPRSAAWLEHWSVGSLTGARDWLPWLRRAAPPAARARPAPGRGAEGALGALGAQGRGQDAWGGVDCWAEDSAPVLLASGLFPARDFRKHDTVISIPSRFPPEARARRFGARPTLAFFAGSPNSCARRRVLELYAQTPGFDVSSDFLADGAYREKMWSSRFCLVMRGSSHTNNVRLYDVIAHGCIPVIISDDFQPPLDAWLPWRDMSIFLPTSSIPRLEQILRREIDEAARWRYFENLVLGRSSRDGERAAALLAAGTKTLDRETLWSGLSAARVFNWHATDFWLLFLADVAMKLSARVSDAEPHRAVSDGVAAQAQDGPFQWQRQDWWSAAKTTGDEAAQAQRLLLSGMHWLYNAAKSGETSIPGIVVSCGLASMGDLARMLDVFGGRPSPDGKSTQPLAMLTLEPSLEQIAELEHTSVAQGWASVGWRGIHGTLDDGSLRTSKDPKAPIAATASSGVLLAPEAGSFHQEGAQISLGSAIDLAVAAAAPKSVLPVIYLLRIGPRCGTPACRTVLQPPAAVPVKFLLLEGLAEHCQSANLSAEEPRRPEDTGEALAQAGWLCFCPCPGGGLRPAFAPFPPLHACGRGAVVLCGRESDADLDAAVRLVSGGALAAGPPPARWGAAPAAPGAVPRAATRGRFLYATQPGAGGLGGGAAT